MEKIDKKMRVLHATAFLSPSSGMLKQMEWEKEASDSLDINWRVVMYCPINTPIKSSVLHYDNSIDAHKLKSRIYKFFAWLRLRYNYNRWLLQQKNNVDVFLLRYSVHDPFQLNFIRKCNKPVFFVHHTLEVPELAMEGGIKGYFRASLEMLFGLLTIPKSSGLIGVTQEIVNYEVSRSKHLGSKNFIYPNGILFKNIVLEDRRSHNLPELLFVANFAPWHGLDILLKSISNSNAEFVLHIVGNVPNDLEFLTIDHRIKKYGHLSQDEIAVLASQCWIGLSSFGLFRNKMKHACPLKVREYLMLGLPVYGSYTDVFDKKEFYFKNGSSEITEIIDFAKKSRTVEFTQVRNAAKISIDKQVLLQNLYMEINKSV
jgi:glycosyltransferase involved in cell wall biosynthesis